MSLDDLGTGSSGLAYLPRLPLDEIKLDRSFTRRSAQDERAERIIEGTIRLAHRMGWRWWPKASRTPRNDAACKTGAAKWAMPGSTPQPYPADLRDWPEGRDPESAALIPLRRAISNA